MSNLLFVSSSIATEASVSRRVAGEFVDSWRAANPNSAVVERHLTSDNIPHLSGETFAAAMTPVDKRSLAQQAAVAFADTLIGEVEAADTIVVASPMYNFSIPSTLKAWFDHLARAGRTFGYGANGPEGLLKNKRVIAVVSRGGHYAGDAPAHGWDLQEPYIRTFFKFLGIEDVTFVYVEGQARGEPAATQGLTLARSAIATLVPAALAA